MLHVACLISKGAGVNSPGMPLGMLVSPRSRLEGWIRTPGFPVWRSEDKALVQGSGLLMPQSSNCN